MSASDAPLTRNEAFTMLPELALGMLTSTEAERVLAFGASADLDAQAELASLRAAAGALGSSVPAAPMAPARKSAMRDRLLARAASSSTADATGSAEPVRDVAQQASAASIDSTPTTAPALPLEPRNPAQEQTTRAIVERPFAARSGSCLGSRRRRALRTARSRRCARTAHCGSSAMRRRRH
ncbi:MAG: hypothetical protein U5K74_16335 [Gemmatimonadaceae bacterium]|nr:hypothetical protein [Gemmatimonadaceae bacterium]